MIINYPEKGEKTMQKGTRHPNENLGGANIFPESEESIQTYARGSDGDHPDEAMKEEAPADAQWPIKSNVKEYPRHGD